MSNHNFTIIRKLPSAQEIIQEYPLADVWKNQIQSDRNAIKQILGENDQRLLLIVGPCSAWPKTAVIEYAERLSKLNDKVKHVIKLVMRAYVQKPRTSIGWVGPAYQPDPFGPPDITAGMRYVREILMHIISMGLPVASEIVFTQNSDSFIELLTWAAIGARSSEDPEHRIFASAIDFPVGMKNPANGHVSTWINGVVVAQHQHATIVNGHEVKTHGNKHAHLVLRGCNGASNYSVKYLREIRKHMFSAEIDNPAILIDASHDNCLVNRKKNPFQQANIILNILKNLKYNTDLKRLVKGFMLESFLKTGNQRLDDHNSASVNLSGLSVTDPCLGWEETEETILKIAHIMEN